MKIWYSIVLYNNSWKNLQLDSYNLVLTVEVLLSFHFVLEPTKIYAEILWKTIKMGALGGLSDECEI